jgi:uncharacterized membrane protein
MTGAKKARSQPTDRLLGGLLLTGVRLSALCLIAGLVLTELGRATGRSDGDVPHRLLNIGLVILMATPITRVLVSLVDEIRSRNWFFAIITALVVALLSATLTVAWRALRS